MLKKALILFFIAILSGCASNLQRATQISYLHDFDSFGQPKATEKLNWEGLQLKGNIKSIEGKMFRVDPEKVVPDYICASYVKAWDSTGKLIYFIGKDSIGKEIVNINNLYAPDGKILISSKISNAKDSSVEKQYYKYNTAEFEELVDFYKNDKLTYSIGFKFNEKGKASQVKILYPKKRTYTYIYDSKDSILHIKNKEGSGIHYEYDKSGNIIEYSSVFLLHTYIYKAQNFDSLGRKTASSYFNEINQIGTTTEYVYKDQSKTPAEIKKSNNTLKIYSKKDIPERAESIDEKGNIQLTIYYTTDSANNIISSTHKKFMKKYKEFRPILRYEYTIKYWNDN